MQNDDAEHDGRPSKSARKREHQALQALAEALIALPAARFRALALGERTREEFERARAMAPSGSRNRQVRLLAQLLLEEDIDALRAAPEALARSHGADTALHHAAERLRDALLESGPAALEPHTPDASQRARAARLLADAAALTDGVRARTARRDLYRLARELLASGS